MSEKRDFLLTFIHIYRDLPVLWNQKHPKYNDRNARSSAYNRLLDFYKNKYPEATRVDLVKKINSLRVNFRKELKKVKRFGESQIGIDNTYKPTLWYFNEMKFILDQETSGGICMIKNEESADNSKDSIDSCTEEEHQQPSIVHNPTSSFDIVKSQKDTKHDLEQNEKATDVQFFHTDEEMMIMAKAYALKLSKMTTFQRLLSDKLINDVLLEGQLGNLTKRSSIILHSNNAVNVLVEPSLPILGSPDNHSSASTNEHDQSYYINCQDSSFCRNSSGSQVGDLGSGAGKGGGGGGSIREAGGAFGRMEAGREEEYFYKQQKEQLERLKEDLGDEINFHEEQIKRHQDAIERHKQRLTKIDN